MSEIYDESMSSFKTYAECKKKWEYRYKRGLVPLQNNTETLDIGTLYHAGMAEGYRHGIYNLDNWVENAHNGIDITLRDGYDYHGERRVLNVEKEKVQLVKDMLEFYWENLGQHDVFDEIIAVEESFSLYINGRTITNTFDLLVRQQGRLCIWDHKTVGSVNDTLAFLPLDMQSNMYQVAAWLKFGEPVEFMYNIARRAVPRELTASGRKSTASKDPADYLRRVNSIKSEGELRYVYEELKNQNQEMRQRTWFPREPQKGFMGCNGCAYRDICSAEQTGKRVSKTMLEMSYEIRSV